MSPNNLAETILNKLESLDSRLDTISVSLAKNEMTLNNLEKQTDVIASTLASHESVLSQAQGAVKAGKVAAWMAALAASVGALWQLLHY